jgi:hypothetical protein
MSYAVDPPRRRPGAVTAASILLFVAAAALLAEAIVMYTQIGPVSEQLKPLYPEAEFQGNPNAGRSVARGMFGLPAAGALIFAVTLGVLGALDLAGKNWARICTWVFGGLGMVCCGCTSAVYAGLGLTNLAAQIEGQSGPNASDPGPTTEEFMNAVDRAIPEWYTMTLIGLGSIVVLSVLIAVILIALPAAGEYFRKPPIIWVPPTAGPAPAAWSGYGPPPTPLPERPRTDLPNPPGPEATPPPNPPNPADGSTPPEERKP